MDIAPVYELKARLRAAAIAGTNLISEDFRLKKAAESFAPLAQASPVFTKINEMTAKLLSDGSPENLLDTITLVDAVITTLGAVDVQGEPEDIAVSGSGTAIVNAPYSQLSAILSALTESGGGQYNAFMEVKENHHELLHDYRVKPALIKGLGASYAELADEVAKTVGDMGKEMLPLLKSGFDPKGKKEMLRRVSVIERIAGAEANDFYLEQLENAEKDIRKTLIYALRHDENNIDRLFELVKTEKGSSKTAALHALASFEDERAGAYVAEYSKKKPAEVIRLMDGVSSKWSSELTAQLIEQLLVDKDGNRITLSQAAEIDNVRLKNDIKFWDIASALKGKFGESIERIYRDLDNRKSSKFTDNSRFMDNALGDSIIKTGDESLKKLAIELNNSPKTKGQYVYAEAVTRLLGDEDCSQWIEKQVSKIYGKKVGKSQEDTNAQAAITRLLGGDSAKWVEKKFQEIYDTKLINSPAIMNTQIMQAVSNITFEDGKYSIGSKYYDSILDRWLPETSAPINQPIRGAITDIFIKYPSVQFDLMIAGWADPEDKEYCKKLADMFVEHAVSKESDTAISLTYVKRIGIGNIKGLAVRYCKNHPNKNRWALQGFFNVLPGDHEYFRSEAREVVELMRSGKLKMDLKKEDIDVFADWAETRFNYLNK